MANEVRRRGSSTSTGVSATRERCIRQAEIPWAYTEIKPLCDLYFTRCETSAVYGAQVDRAGNYMVEGETRRKGEVKKNDADLYLDKSAFGTFPRFPQTKCMHAEIRRMLQKSRTNYTKNRCIEKFRIERKIACAIFIFLEWQSTR